MNILQTPIEYLKGVGPIKADLLKKELKIYYYEDLLYHFPFRYIDRTKIYKISEINADFPFVQFKGKITKLEEKGQKRNKRLVAYFADNTSTIELVWFKGIRWIKSSIKINEEYIVFGKPSYFQSKVNIIHPELDLFIDYEKSSSSMQAVYSSTEKLNARGLNSRAILRLIKTLLNQLDHHIEETLSDSILNKFQLPSKSSSLFQIHLPNDPKSLIRAQKRLKFEELFFLQLHLLKLKVNRNKKFKGYHFPSLGKNFNNFYNNHLNFTLTNAQKKVLREIRSDVKSSKQMNRLLQGDVGSGKTIVSLLSMLMAIDNNFQACLMAPTEILSRQHFETISNYLHSSNLNVSLLTGSSKKKERSQILEGLKNGQINILIGTHALLEDSVKFNNLGMIVIDEQHRFGVAQRAKLWKKNDNPPHVLVMTATPIPRTLSMTLYGDLDISVIDELPPGRKEIQTMWKTDSSRLFVINFMREQISLGRQVYVVFPLIEESETLDYKNLMDGFDSIEREFPLPDFQVSVVHGRMKAEDKDYEMKRFAEGVTNILIATTVIEVGVNVPNASVMIIESAERFGLSQLHQLRGRVGRGNNQSFCILVSGNKLSNESKTRLKTMVETNDGFKISEVDLKLRGPGDIMGTMQSGILDFKIADIVKDTKILDFARNEASLLLKNDPDLSKADNINIARSYGPYSREKTGWSRIS